MIVGFLEKRGYRLPPKETDISSVPKEEIMEKIQEFWHRYERITNNDLEDAPIDFLDLLTNYPVSLCKRQMSGSLKLLLTLSYLGSKPEGDEENPVWNGFSYEYSALISVRSKASIHNAIRQKEGEVKQLLEDSKLRAKAKALALEELVKEEKLKLLEKKSKRIEETTERTPKRVEHEGIHTIG